MKRSPSRRGAVLVAVLVSLLIVTSILASTVAGTLHRRAHLRLLHRVRQAEMLVTAGLELALRNMRRDASYGGEVWTPLVVKSPDEQNASVSIEVAESPNGRRVKILVVYPLDAPHPVLRSGSFSFPTGPSEEDS